MTYLRGLFKRHALFVIAFLCIFTLSIFSRNTAYSAVYNYSQDPTIAWTYSNNPTDDYDWPLLTATHNGYIYLFSYSYPGGDEKWNLEKINEASGLLDTSFGIDGKLEFDPISSLYPKKIIINETGIYFLIEADDTETTTWSAQKLNTSTGLADILYEHALSKSEDSSCEAYPVQVFDDGANFTVFGYDSCFFSSSMKWITAKFDYSGNEITYNETIKADITHYLRDVVEDESYYYIYGENSPEQDWYIQKIAKSNLGLVWQTDYNASLFGFAPDEIAVNDIGIYFIGNDGTTNQVGSINKVTGTVGWGGETQVASGEGIADFGGISVDNDGVYLFEYTNKGCDAGTCYGYMVERWDAETAVKTHTIVDYHMFGDDYGDIYIEGGSAITGGFYTFGERSMIPGTETNDYEWFIKKYTFAQLEAETNPPVFENLYDADKPINLDEGQEISSKPYVIRVHPTDQYGVESVKFYVNDELRATENAKDVNGEYLYSWSPALNESNIRVEACDGFDNCASIVRNILFVPNELVSGTLNIDMTELIVKGFSYPNLILVSNGKQTIYLYNIESDTTTEITAVDSVSQYPPAISGDYIVWPDKVNYTDAYRTVVTCYQISTGERENIRTGSDGVVDVAISGDNVVWQEGASGVWRLSVYQISTGQTTMLSRISDDFMGYEFDVRADKIVYSNYLTLDGGNNYDAEIFVYDIDTGQTTRITGTENLAWDDDSPVTDGRYVAYQCSRDTDNPFELCVYDLNSGTEEVIYDSDTDGMFPPGISDGYIYTKNGAGLKVYDVVVAKWVDIEGDTNITNRLIDENLVFSMVSNVDLGYSEPTITEVYSRDLINPIFINFEGSADRINIVSGQTIAVNPYKIQVKPLDNNSTGSYPPGGIEKVEFYVDDVLIGTDYNSDNEGFYDYNWDTSLYHSDIRVIAYDINGNQSEPLPRDAVVDLPSDEITIPPVDDIGIPVPLPGAGTDSEPYHDPDNQPDAKDIADNSEVREEKLDRQSSPILEDKASTWGESILDMIKEVMTAFIAEVPPAVAFAFPYLLFVLLAIAACLAFFQAKSELSSIGKLIRIAEAEKDLYEEKANFLMLSSHYLRTPMTLIKGGLEMLETNKKVGTKAVSKIKTAVLDLGKKIEKILKDIENSSYLAGIKAPQVKELEAKKYVSLYVIVPIALVALIVLVSNILFVNAEKISPSVLNFLTQAVLLVIVSQLLIVSVRKMYNAKKETEKYKVVINHQRNMDRARSLFMASVGSQLNSELQEIRDFSDNSKSQDEISLKEGEYRLELVLNKIKLLALVQKSKGGSFDDEVSIDDTIRSINASFADKIKEKELDVKYESTNVNIVSDKEKITYILTAILDNAIKFNKQKGTIEISAKSTEEAVVLVIKDSGIGIEKDDLVHLFKPFSRAGSALDFSYEGLGLGLYLCKVLAHYLGGEVTLDTRKDKGTIVTVTLKNWVEPNK